MPGGLELDGVRVRYPGRVVLDGLSLAVRPGECVGLAGANGAGKSTALAVAAGLLDPEAGTVAVGGVARAADPRRFAARVGLVPQESAVYDELTAAANVAFFGRLFGLGGKELRRRVARGLARVRLTDRADDRAGTFSGGLRQRLNLACALVHDPPVLLLDEPTAALDPASRDALYADLDRVRDDGHAVLLTTHHLDEAEGGCDRLAVLHAGKVAAVGKPADLLRADPGGRRVLYAHLERPLPKFQAKALRRRLGDTAQMELTGRRLRLAADTGAALGDALACVLTEGADLATVRTPPGSLERAVGRGAA